VSGSLDGLLKCWNLKSLALEGHIDVGSKISNIALHPTSCLAAVACDDLSIKVCDIEARTIVRRYRGHADRITDLQFSEDCRWLLTSSMDSTLRVWDVPGTYCPFHWYQSFNQTRVLAMMVCLVRRNAIPTKIHKLDDKHYITTHKLSLYSDDVAMMLHFY
jgi:WD40 repeat protein